MHINYRYIELVWGNVAFSEKFSLKINFKIICKVVQLTFMTTIASCNSTLKMDVTSLQLHLLVAHIFPSKMRTDFPFWLGLTIKGAMTLHSFSKLGYFCSFSFRHEHFLKMSHSVMQNYTLTLSLISIYIIFLRTNQDSNDYLKLFSNLTFLICLFQRNPLSYWMTIVLTGWYTPGTHCCRHPSSWCFQSDQSVKI